MEKESMNGLSDLSELRPRGIVINSKSKILNPKQFRISKHERHTIIEKLNIRYCLEIRYSDFVFLYRLSKPVNVKLMRKGV